MFEQTLVLSRAQRRGVDPRWLPVAALAHAAFFAALLAAQGWRVDDVPAARESSVFVILAPPPPPPAERQAERPPHPAAAERRDEAPVVPAPPTVQPAVVPDNTPVAEPTLPAVDGSFTEVPFDTPTGDSSSPEGGVDGGVESFIRYTVGMTPPTVIERVEPAYTEPARRARRQGSVLLEATIDRSGTVVRVDVLRSLGFGLDEEAVRAVRRWRFTAARRNEEPVGVVYLITVKYELR